MDVLGAINVLAASDSEGMFNRGWDIFGNLGDWALSMVYNFITFLLQVVYSIEGAFYYLTGLGSIRGLGVENGISGLLPTLTWDETNNVFGFDEGVLIGQSSFQNAIFFMLIIGVIMAVFFLIYGALKGAFNREGKTAAMIKMSLANALRATIFLIFAPIVVMLVLGTITFCLGLIFQGLFSILLNFSFSDDGGTMQITSSSTSIAYNIYKACFLGGSSDMTKFAAAVNAGEFNSYTDYISHLDETKEILGIGKDEVCVVQYADQFSIVFFPLKDLVLKTQINFSSQYSYGIGFCGGIFALVALAILTIRAGERLFEILIDYFLCFPAISTMPIDNGQRLGQWSQLFLGRIINFSGSVIAMAIYIFVLGNIPNLLNQFEEYGGITAMFFKGIVLLVLIIAGAYACVKGGNTVAQLIGSAAASAEANSMQQTMGLAHLSMHGLQLGGRALSRGFATGVGGGTGVFKNLRGAQTAKTQQIAAQSLANKQNAVYDQLLSGGVGLGTGLAIGAAANNIKNAVPSLSKGDSNNISGGDNGSGKAESNQNAPIQPSSNENNSINNGEASVNHGKSPMQELKGEGNSALTKKEKAKNVAGTIFGSATKSAKNAISSSGSITGKIIGGTAGFVGGLVGAGIGATASAITKGTGAIVKGTGKGIYRGTKYIAGKGKEWMANTKELSKEIKKVKNDDNFKQSAKINREVYGISQRLINKEAKYIAKENITNRKKEGGKQ